MSLDTNLQDEQVVNILMPTAIIDPALSHKPNKKRNTERGNKIGNALANLYGLVRTSQYSVFWLVGAIVYSCRTDQEILTQISH